MHKKNDSLDGAKVLLIYGRTNKHLGLWSDLESNNLVILACAELRECGRITRILQRFFLKIDHKLFGSTSVLKHIFYQYHNLFDIASHVKHIIIIDGALNQINISELEKCRRINSNLIISLYLLNSIEASSPLMRRIKGKIRQFKWDNIYTFDEADADKYGYKYLGFCYYSTHNIAQTNTEKSDAYFVGGLKGGRTNIINEVYNKLRTTGCHCDFNLMTYSDGSKTEELLEGVKYYRGWRSYEAILSQVQQTNCIVEIIQTGQSGATLRYFEAVTQNKKLLTNNTNICKFPFFNPRWMKIFSSIEDIDVEWIRKVEDVNYGYKGEFSPIHFIDYITKDNEKV